MIIPYRLRDSSTELLFRYLHCTLRLTVAVPPRRPVAGAPALVVGTDETASMATADGTDETGEQPG